MNTEDAIKDITERFWKYDKWDKEKFFEKLFAALQYLAETAYDVKHNGNWLSICPSHWKVSKPTQVIYTFDLFGTIKREKTATDSIILEFMVAYRENEREPFQVAGYLNPFKIPLLDPDLERHFKGNHSSFLNLITILFNAMSKQDHRYQELKVREKEIGDAVPIVSAPPKIQETASDAGDPLVRMVGFLNNTIEDLKAETQWRGFIPRKDGTNLVLYGEEISLIRFARKTVPSIEQDISSPIIGTTRTVIGKDHHFIEKSMKISCYGQTFAFTYTYLNPEHQLTLTMRVNDMVAIEKSQKVTAFSQDTINTLVNMLTRECIKEINTKI